MREQTLTFAEQLRLQRLRRFEEENARHDTACREHLRVLQTVLDCMDDAVMITEPTQRGTRNARIQYVNPAFARLTGYTADDAVGKTPRLLEGPEREAHVSQQTDAAVPAGDAITATMTCYRKDATEFHAEIKVYAAPTETGEGADHWITLLRDVTTHKFAEEASQRVDEAEQENRKLAAKLAEYKSAEERLSHAAFHDSLTGLRNREYFMERLREALLRVQTRPDYKSFLVYLDLDGFKLINDGLGHRAGDQVLQDVAARLVKCCRPQDTIARHGGDEFTVLLSHVASHEAAVTIAERLLEELNKSYDALTTGYSISASLGVCEIEPRYKTADDVLRDADSAMYRAKQEGGSRMVSFDQAMHARSVALVQRKAKLRQAVQQGDLALLYQPVVDMRNRRMLAVEALLRWPGDATEDVRSVITLAEQTGAMMELGMWVLRQAATQLRRWRTLKPNSTFTLNVNISSRQLEAPEFLGCFIDLVAETGLDCRSLQMEVSEQLLLQDSDALKQALRELRMMGVRIALDDFGTGYAALGHLESYPIDTLKIDGEFLRGLEDAPGRGETVRAMVQVAKGLRLRTVAEGVEEQAQEDSLRAFGCTIAQGYLYSAPCTAHEITEKWIPGAY